MNAHVPMSDLFRVLLPRDYPNGWLSMLTTYFDDSGTHTGGKHGPSKVVLVGGIFGTESRLGSLERNWQKLIDNPIDGTKKPLKRFHMADCQAGKGEFEGWTRTEIDYFCHQLMTVMIEAEISAYGIAIARKDWDELVTGDALGFLGDAESYCITQCFVCAIRWAQQNSFDPKMTFVFDRRTPEIERRTKAVGDAFDRHTMSPRIVGYAFMNSVDIRPLQAADMFAWEVYQHANEIYADGVIKPPKREALRRLFKALPTMQTQIALRPAIQNIVDYVRASDPEFLRQAANHFTFFDPAKPDYSHLSEKPPA